jgi:hypothetical protein
MLPDPLVGLLAKNAMEGEIRARVGCLVRQLSARSIPLIDHLISFVLFEIRIFIDWLSRYLFDIYSF